MVGPEGRLAGDARSRLYDVMRLDATTDERVRRALEVGTEYFGVFVGDRDNRSDVRRDVWRARNGDGDCHGHSVGRRW
jgi:hypothetical protein